MNSIPGILGLALVLSEIGLNFVKRARGAAVVKDRNSLGLIWMVNLAGAALAVYCAFHFRSWRMPSRQQACVLGVSVFAIGIMVRWCAIIQLGRFFTVNVAIAADHRLVDTGLYRWLRHPSYTGSLLMILGLGLSMANFASLLIVLLAFFLGLLRRIHIEESALLEALGAPYRDYMGRTRRLIPFIY